jgi:hypothetical protein
MQVGTLALWAASAVVALLAVLLLLEERGPDWRPT